MLGLERDRAAIVGRAGSQRPTAIWNLDALHAFEGIQLTDPTLRAACEAANHHLQIRGTIEPARSLFIDVARALNALSWDRTLHVTDDFVVYAADVEKGGTSEEVAACVPSARLSLLRARNLV
jgi:hypothetical protein